MLWHIVYHILCHISCQTHHWAPRHWYSTQHNPSFLWTCEMFGFSFRADVCRGSFETLPPFVCRNGVKETFHPPARTVSGEVSVENYSNVPLRQERWGFSGGNQAGWKLDTCEVIWWPDYVWKPGEECEAPHDGSWIQTEQYTLNTTSTEWFDDFSLFSASAGLPYGWEEAYTADGVKYYIK